MNVTEDFANPEFFYLLGVIPLWIVWYVLKYKKQSATIRISSLKAFAKAPKSYKNYLQHALFGFRVIAYALLVVALARPQSSEVNTETLSKEGIDIMLSMDVSTSMKAEDFKPNRLEAAKKIAIEFVSGRKNDRIGVVVYAGESFTQCPLTTDHKVVKNLLREVKDGLIEDGTAIGMGLATAVSRLKDSKAKSKVVILLTDGMNNSGFIDPLTAADLAEQNGIKVYTIGIGKYGKAPYPVEDVWGRKRKVDVDVEIDEELLKGISAKTNGQYFRADNNDKLRDIYKQIEALEKTEIEELKFYNFEEKFGIYAMIALGLLVLESVLRFTLLRSFI